MLEHLKDSISHTHQLGSRHGLPRRGDERETREKSDDTPTEENHHLALQKTRSSLPALGTDAVQEDCERWTLPSVVSNAATGVRFITLITNSTK